MADQKSRERYREAALRFVSRVDSHKIGALTLSGRRIKGSRYSLWRSVAQNESVNLWERLLERELRPEQEVRSFSETLANYWLRYFDSVEDSILFTGREVSSELELFSLHFRELRDFDELRKDIPSPGWNSWEIIYVIGLRMLDASIKNLDKRRVEIGAFLLMESIQARAFGDYLGEGQQHRNKEHLVELGEQAYRDKLRELEHNERQKRIASKKRPDALQKVVLRFLLENKRGTWKQLAHYLDKTGNDSDATVQTISFDSDRIEWLDDRGRIRQGSLQNVLANRLTRARKGSRKP